MVDANVRPFPESFVLSVQMTLLFSITLFSSATLLFLVQPMVGKILLPYLGGSPSVWNTCMVFFQAALLGGYGYAHWLTRGRTVQKQIQIHGIVLAVAFLPLLLMRFDPGFLARTILPPPASFNPALWLLVVLTLVAGLPFFAVSTSAPLLQKWFSTTNHPDAKDPYFLYGASNLGSMLALLAYPFLFEPRIGVNTQTWLWVGGFLGLMGLTWLCGIVASSQAAPDVAGAEDSVAAETPLSNWTRFRWVALAIIPSSMMLGTTTYLTTDIAAIPLLWILPLSLYILSFILVFSEIPGIVYTLFALGSIGWILLKSAGLPQLESYSVDDLTQWLTGAGQAMGKDMSLTYFQLGYILAGASLFILFFRSHNTIRLGMFLCTAVLLVMVIFQHDVKTKLAMREFEVIGMHLALLFCTAMLCHGEMARTRPVAVHLTEFFLWMSLGGVLGGIFNALIAPLVFHRILEYPLVAAFAFVLLPSFEFPSCLKYGALALRCSGLLLGILAGLTSLVHNCLDKNYALETADKFPESFRGLARMVARGCNDRSAILMEERNFFGCFTVNRWESATTGEIYHTMYHGTTNHGMQCVSPEARRRDTLTYFHKRGAIGQLFEAVEKKKAGQPVRMAVLGVGTGTLAAYAQPGWALTMYEIDPAVVRTSIDRKDYFSFIHDAKERNVKFEVILGDGRQQFQKAADASYDLIFMDAFTSDAVPVHLLTREAFDIYLKKLAPGGIVVINIANRYLNFEQVLGNMVQDRGIKGLIQGGFEIREIDKYGTNWVVMARTLEDFGELPKMNSVLKTDAEEWTESWRAMETNPALGVWTDDYSNLPSIFKWGR